MHDRRAQSRIHSRARRLVGADLNRMMCQQQMAPIPNRPLLQPEIPRVDYLPPSAPDEG